MEVLSKEEIDRLTSTFGADDFDDEVDPCDAAFVDGLLNSINFAEEQRKLKEKEIEDNQLLQAVTTSTMDNEAVPTMAQSMGIKFDKTPTYAETLDKVNASFGIKQPKRGKLSKLRPGFDALKGRKSGGKVLSDAEVDWLLQSVTSSEIDETVPTMAQSMGIKLSKNPTYDEVVDKVCKDVFDSLDASFGGKPATTQPDREI